MVRDYIIQNVFSNWNFFRIIRTVLAIVILIQSFQMNDPLLGLFGGAFMLQVLTNTGCCGTSGCAVPNVSSNLPAEALAKAGEVGNSSSTEVKFTEVKNDQK